MISLAGRDILHAWGKFVFTGIGLGLLIGVTLTMAGVYRGMVDDAKVLLDNSGADLWVVQQDTLGPYAESSSLYDDTWRGIVAMDGVARVASVTYLTMQVRVGGGNTATPARDVRAMVVGVTPDGPGHPGQPGYLVAGRHITRSHYEAVADIATGFALGDRVRIRRNEYTVVGLTKRMVSSGGDPMVFIPLRDAQEAQFLKDNDAIVRGRARTLENPALNRPSVPGLADAVIASQSTNPYVNAVLVQVQPGADPEQVAEPIRRWKRLTVYTQAQMPSAPHFNRNPLDLVAEAEKAGATDEAGVAKHVVEQLKSGALDVAFADPDNPVNWPRNLIVWRANLIGTSAKGHEYFLKHLLGAQNGVMSEGGDGNNCKEVKWHEKGPTAKLDLMVDINFRLNSTGAYSDIILPTATWYEKHDLNTTDMHPFIHPLSEAVSPGWESRSDWQIFKGLAKKFSSLAGKHLGVKRDLVALPMQHDSAFEMAQPLGQVKDWKRGECEPVPGKTMPLLKLVERDYATTYNKFIALGPLMLKLGNNVKGIDWNTDQEYKELASLNRTVTEPGVSFGMPSLEEDIAVCDSVMRMAPETNGEVAHKSWSALSKKTGIDHHHLYAGRQEDKITFRDIQAQPRKIITAPTWSGIESEHVSYTAGYTNIHEHIPFRTLTGRAHFYQDHEWFLDFGEGFCCLPRDIGRARKHFFLATRASHHGRQNSLPTLQQSSRSARIERRIWMSASAEVPSPNSSN